MKRTVDSNWFLHTLNSEELFKNKIGDKLIIFFSLAQIKCSQTYHKPSIKVVFNNSLIFFKKYKVYKGRHLSV